MDATSSTSDRKKRNATSVWSLKKRENAGERVVCKTHVPYHLKEV